MRITCHYVGICLEQTINIIKGNLGFPFNPSVGGHTSPLLAFFDYCIGAGVSTKKRTIILCFTQYDCRNGCIARTELIR